jgi:hypothetical protein
MRYRGTAGRLERPPRGRLQDRAAPGTHHAAAALMFAARPFNASVGGYFPQMLVLGTRAFVLIVLRLVPRLVALQVKSFERASR